MSQRINGHKSASEHFLIVARENTADLRTPNSRSPRLLFRQLNRYLGQKNIRPTPWRGVETHLIRIMCDQIHLRYRNTNVVTVTRNGVIHLDSGGHLTPTTKRRMNDILRRVGCFVYQTGGLWFIVIPGQRAEYYEDGMMLQCHNNGQWSIFGKYGKLPME
jgi:hypothetical protein